MLELPHDETLMFDAGYPLLRAYPALDVVCLLLLHDHRWHRHLELACSDLGIAADSAEIICVQRIDPALPWEVANVRVVVVPNELRPFHRVEHDDWLRTHGRSSR